MGYVLFTQSGTFNPSDYGLNVGDVLQVTCVGGGASGTGSKINNAGAASSFGSYVTANGGNAHKSATAPAAPLANQRPGELNARYINISTSSHSFYYFVGPAGAPGWMPNIGLVPAPVAELVAPNIYSGSNTPLSRYIGYTGIQAYVYSDGNILCAAGPNYGGCGTISNSNYAYGLAPGGYGYGAGGGGSCRYTNAVSTSFGGNSGAVTEAVIKLSSVAAISVTVGKGGASVSNTAGAESGEGAPGCVAVFW